MVERVRARVTSAGFSPGLLRRLDAGPSQLYLCIEAPSMSLRSIA